MSSCQLTLREGKCFMHGAEPPITTVLVNGETIYRATYNAREVRSHVRSEVEAYLQTGALPAGYHGAASDF